MSLSPLLKIPHVAPTQANKELTINTAVNRLEAAFAERLRINFTGSPQAGSYEFSNTEWNNYWLFEFGLHDSDKDIVIPADRQRPFVVANAGSYDLNVIIDGIAPGPGTQIVVAPGNAGYIYAMGEKLYAMSEGASGIGATFSLSIEEGPTSGTADAVFPSIEVIRYQSGDFDVSGTGAQVLVRLSTPLREAANRSDLAIFFPGQPQDETYLARIAFASSTYFQNELGCVVVAREAPTGNFTMQLLHQADASSPELVAGTITIPSGLKTGTVAFVDDQLICIAGSILSFIGPPTIDPTCVDVSVTLKGTKIGT